MTSLQKFRYAVWALVALLIAGAAVYWVSKPHDEAVYINQVNNDDKAIATEFTLVDMDGKTVTADSWPGQYKLVYFGYSNCPDVCPIGLQTIADALVKLPVGLQDKIQPLFISIDPERDDSKALKIFTAQFHSKIIGLTGNKDAIEKVAANFKVYAARVPEPEGVTPSDDEYLVDHSDIVYLLDQNSKFIKAYESDQLKPELLAKDLQKIVTGK